MNRGRCPSRGAVLVVLSDVARETEEREKKIKYTVHALCHITFRVVIGEGLIFIPMKQFELRFKNVEKLA